MSRASAPTGKQRATLVKNLRQLWSEWRDRGFYGVGLRISASTRLPTSLFMMTETEIVRLVQLNGKALQRKPEGYEWLQVGREAIDGLLDCSPEPGRETLRRAFERFFAEGASCYVSRLDGEVAAYAWAFPRNYVLTYDSYRGRNLNVRLDGNSMFLGNGLIGEKHRLRGLFPHLMAFVVAQWPVGTDFYSAIDCNNVHSLRSHYRLGFVTCEQVLCVTVLGKTWFFKRVLPGSAWESQSASEELTIPAPMLASMVNSEGG